VIREKEAVAKQTEKFPSFLLLQRGMKGGFSVSDAPQLVACGSVLCFFTVGCLL
jgi:hypothetical protein